jgi:adenosylcobinamide-GDP ribazoletransferase
MLKVVLLSHLPAAMLSSALLIFPAMSRGGMVWGMWMAPYARPEGGTGEAFFRTLGRRHVWIATILLSAWVVLLTGWGSLILLGLSVGATRLFVAYCDRRIGGMTGDTLGALNELLELLTLAVFYPLSRWQMAPGSVLSPRFFW